MSAPSAAPDVETTNWNAVKLLAAKHGIHLRPYEEPASSTEAHDGAVTAHDAAEEQDLGAGTPFRITAKRLEGGRIIYRFKYRGDAPAAAPAPAAAMPKSHSETAGLASLAQRGPEGADAADAKPRKNLKGSRSIPTLRALHLLAAGAGASRTPDMRSTRVEEEEREAGSQASAPDAAESGNADARREAPRAPGRTPLLPVSRGISDSPIELRAPPRRDGRLQGGDVLGAILGLREGIVDARSPRSGTSHSRASSDSGAASMPSTRLAATPFGQHLGINGAPATPNEFVRSPIPRMLELGEPLFDDMPAFSPSSRSPQHSQGSSPRRRRQQEGDSFSSSIRERVLREAQSFESTDSAATARASDEHVRPGALSSGGKSRAWGPLDDDEHAFARSSDPETLIFDVLQHYALSNDAQGSASSSNRSSLTPSVGSGSSGPSTESTSERSAQDATTSATCGDDPRFALWAVRDPENSEGGLVLCARSGRTAPAEVPTTGPSSTPQPDGKRRSTRVADAPNRNTARPRSASRTSKVPPPPSTVFPPPDRAFLIAATPTLMVAELTSEIDNRLLADFFYTYRTFITPSALLQLLTLRFRWAMTERVEPREEARRRIVRVRTYVVLKHWLLHFFEVDFLPDRQLRQQLTDWLNALGADPRLAARPADASIVRSLKNTVRSLKAQYQSMGMSALLMHDAGRRPSSHSVQHHRTASSSSGSVHDAGSPANTSVSSAGTQEHVDLDFSDASSDDVRQSPASGRPSGAGQRGNVQLNMAAATALGSPISPTVAGNSAHRHTLAPMIPQGPAPAPQQPPTLPSSQGAISRVFVNTVGRISRFKRVLGARGAHSGAFPAVRDTVGFEGLEFEANDSGDLLFIRGGLENFINFFGLRSDDDDDSGELLSSEDGSRPGHTSSDSAGLHESETSAPARSTPASSLDLSQGEADKLSPAHEAGLGIEGLDIADESLLGATSQAPLDTANLHSLELEHKQLELSSKNELLHHTTSAQTLRSQSTAGPPERGPLSAEERQPTIMSRAFDDGRLSMMSSASSMSARPNIVQIDDITDLSSDEDDGAVRRALRRLPGARDLRMAKHVHDLEPEPARSSFDTLASGYGRPIDARSVASFSSHGHASSLGHGSYAPSIIAMQQQRAADAALHPQVIGTVTTDLFDPDEALVGYELVKGFKLDDFDSDEEEAGDIEATLRRLEGVIDEDKQRQKALRVEKLWLESCARKAREDGDAPPAEHPADADVSDAEVDSVASVRALAPDSLNAAASSDSKTELDALLDAVAASSTRDTLAAQRSQLPAVKDSAPLPLGSPTRVVSQSGRRSTARAQQTPTLGVPRGVFQLPPVHHSFLLGATSETVARQLCLIEAELFKAVSWEELVSNDWKANVGEVLDWESFYQARVRRKTEARQRGQRVGEGAVEAIVARFNLACNWVASEIVLTQNVDERAAVVAKFIRVAFVSRARCGASSVEADTPARRNATSSPTLRRSRRSCSACSRRGSSACGARGPRSACGRCACCATSSRLRARCATSASCATPCAT
jgi:hypothetical protein